MDNIFFKKNNNVKINDIINSVNLKHQKKNLKKQLSQEQTIHKAIS